MFIALWLLYTSPRKWIMCRTMTWSHIYKNFIVKTFIFAIFILKATKPACIAIWDCASFSCEIDIKFLFFLWYTKHVQNRKCRNKVVSLSFNPGSCKGTNNPIWFLVWAIFGSFSLYYIFIKNLNLIIVFPLSNFRHDVMNCKLDFRCFSWWQEIYMPQNFGPLG